MHLFHWCTISLPKSPMLKWAEEHVKKPVKSVYFNKMANHLKQIYDSLH